MTKCAIIALLLYGAGLRLLKCVTLRVKDLDFARGEIRVRRGKGGKDRVTMLPGASARRWSGGWKACACSTRAICVMVEGG